MDIPHTFQYCVLLASHTVWLPTLMLNRHRNAFSQESVLIIWLSSASLAWTTRYGSYKDLAGAMHLVCSNCVSILAV